MRILAATSWLFASLCVQSTAQQTCTPVQYELVDASERPDTRNCETKGKLASPQVLSSSRAANLNACINTCKASSGCISFGYQRNTCTLYSKRLIDMGYQQRSTNLGATFANKLCYQPKNIIFNGLFLTQNATDPTQAQGWLGAVSSFEGADNQARFQRACSENDPDDPEQVPISCDLEIDIIYDPPQDPPQNGTVSQQLSCVQVGAAHQLLVGFAGFAYSVAAYVDDVQMFSFICPDGNCNDGSGPYADGTAIPRVVPTRAKPVLRVVFSFVDRGFCGVTFVSFKRVR